MCTRSSGTATYRAQDTQPQDGTEIKNAHTASNEPARSEIEMQLIRECEKQNERNYKLGQPYKIKITM